MPRGVFERKRKPVEERFWSKVNKDTESGCWHFTGALNELGYGQFSINGKMIKAHRYSYELHKGPIPEGMCCLHACDNRKCCNPDHLSIGTHKENMQDMINKNRQNKPKGSMHGRSKLTEDQVLSIKKRIASGEKQSNIAKEFGIANCQITYIKTGTTWAHVQIN
jgi:hypothetical protein